MKSLLDIELIDLYFNISINSSYKGIFSIQSSHIQKKKAVRMTPTAAMPDHLE